MGVSRRRFARLASAAAALSVLRPTQVWAGELEAEIRLDADSVRIGEPLTMQLIVRRYGSGGLPKLPLPEGLEDAFDILADRSGNGFRTLLSGGQMIRESTLTRSLSLAPKTVGQYEFSFSAGTGDTAVESNAVTIEIVAASARLPGDPAEGFVPPEGLGELFVWASVDKTEAYVGEQITYLLDLYKPPDYEVRGSLRRALTFPEFFAETLPEGTSRRAIVGKMTYDVQSVLRRALFPKAAGPAEIPAAELLLGTFGRRVERSRPITVEIKPLPAEGQPPGFSPNNVGKYEIYATVDRTQLGPGDPFTLTVTIEGDGNVALIDPGPWPQVEGVRRYDPKVDTKPRVGRLLGGKRRWEFLMIPERGGKITIPPHEFDYFDPQTGKYAKAKSEALEVEVTGMAAATDVPAPTTTEPEGEELAAIVPGDTLPRHLPRDRWLDRDRWLYGMLAVPVAATLGLGAGALWRRFGSDDAARARARQRQRQKERLDAAEAAVDSGEGFHSQVAALLQELAVRFAGSEGVGLPRPELLRLLDRKGVEPADVRRLEQLLDRCDAARFASQVGTVQERRELLDDALALIRSSALSKEAA